MDAYTKAVLTVIAAALCALVAQNALGPSQAAQVASPPQRVVVCNEAGTQCAGIHPPAPTHEKSGGSLYVKPPQ